jgi:hypothetical protein
MQIEGWRHTYLSSVHDCENCRYFGGLICNHLDEDFNCLGWERIRWQPIKTAIWRYKIWALSRKLKKNGSAGRLKKS